MPDFKLNLKPLKVINNKELCDIFKCSPQGGIRKSNKTNTLVIVSNASGIYQDTWKGDTLHYTGMGQIGDQDINYMQNRTINESATNGIAMYLFECYVEGEYVYRGQVILADIPYQATQNDKNGDSRKVWIFPLKLTTKNSELTGDFIYRMSELKTNKVRKIADKKLENLVKDFNGASGVREVKTTTYGRNEYVAEYVKRRANGICQLCGKEAPFKDKNGEPFLEEHHIVWLSKGGEDSINNAVALCPNCHRKMHCINNKTDVEKLKKAAENSKLK